MIKQKLVKSFIISAILILLLPLTEGKSLANKKTENTDLGKMTEDHMKNIPFVEIGPDWGEDKIVVEEIYERYKKEKAEEKEEGEYDNLAFANTKTYVNVRSLPSIEGEVVGKIYDGSVAEIIETTGEYNDWYKIVSGNVSGYIKSEFFLRGEEAADVMEEYIVRYAKVKADYLNVRMEPDISSKRLGVITSGEKLEVIEKEKDWFKIQYTEEEIGYISSVYVTVYEEFLYAKTLEELEEIERLKKIELEKRQEVVDREGIQEESTLELVAAEGTEADVQQALEISSQVNSDLRQKIVDHAMQFLGNRYVPAGASLEGGTDCSGFTCFIYADFGYSISRTPQGQLSSGGRSISYEQAQPGDIICYSSNGGRSCTHVGIYIGDGQIIHSANSRKGVIIQNADYDRIIGVKNILD